MKKWICVMLALLMLAAVGCSKKTESAPVQGSEETGEAVQQNETDTASSDVAEATEDDFLFEEVEAGKCEITACMYEGKVLKVPETLAGYQVVGIHRDGLAMLQAEEVILPDTVEYLDDYAFNTCENLKKVDLGTGLKRTGTHSFSYCHKLESLSFPEGMEQMNGVAFIVCEELGEVYIPASVTEITGGITSTSYCPNVVIVTPAGSAAEAAATESGLPVKNA